MCNSHTTLITEFKLQFSSIFVSFLGDLPIIISKPPPIKVPAKQDKDTTAIQVGAKIFPFHFCFSKFRKSNKYLWLQSVLVVDKVTYLRIINN